MVKKSKQTSSAWDGTSDGIQVSGPDDFTYSFSDLDTDFTQASMTGPIYTITPGEFDHDDKELRSKYPALQDAWDHYSNIKHMCEQKEKEDEN
jgi:hypothetical protein